MNRLSQNCPPLQQLEHYLSSSLELNETEWVENHVEFCKECEVKLQSLLDSQSFIFKIEPLVENAPINDIVDLEEGRYEYLERLGAGGFGTIWKMRDTKFNRVVAVKVIKSERASKPSLVRRFLAEAQICSQLSHPFVVPIHDMGLLPDGRAYFAMKFIEGKRLNEAFVLGGSINQKVDAFSSLCQAVAHAHERGVIHRDLKPQNVMVGAHGEIQLIDWGLAKATGQPDLLSEGFVADNVRLEQDRTRAALGTLAYIAPEQFKNAATADQRSDVFSLGAILCELLTGSPPLHAKNNQECPPQDRLTDALHRLDTCDADQRIVQVARDCLAENPDLRPAHGGAVADRISGYLDQVATELEQQKIQVANQKLKAEQGARNRKWLSVAAAVLLVATIGFAYMAFRISKALAVETKALEQVELALANESKALAAEKLAKEKETEAKNRAQKVAQNEQAAVYLFSSAFRSVSQSVSPLGSIPQKPEAPKAIDILRQAVIFLEQEHGGIKPDGPTKVELLRSLGVSIQDLGSHQEATAVFEKSKDLAETIFGKDHKEYRISLLWYGRCLRQNGDLRKALNVTKECYQRYHDYNPRLPETLRAAQDVGNCYMRLGEIKDAIRWYRQFLPKYETTFGEIGDTFVHRRALAEALKSDGQFQSAYELHKHTYDQIVDLDRSSSYYARALYFHASYGDILLYLGKEAEGIRILEENLQRQKETYGLFSVSAFYSVQSLAYGYRIQGRFEDSIKLLEPCVQQMRLRLGEKHRLVLKGTQILARSYSGRGDHEKALELLTATLAEQERLFGNLHPNYLNTLGSLGFVTVESGQREAGLKTLESWYELLVQKNGVDHPLSKTARKKIDKVIG